MKDEILFEKDFDREITVDELIETLKNISELGYGNKTLVCNEYILTGMTITKRETQNNPILVEINGYY